MRLAVYSIIGLIVLLECFGRLQVLGADKVAFDLKTVWSDGTYKRSHSAWLDC